MPTADLTIVILSYNVEKLLLACLESVFKSKKPGDKWQVVVVDNISRDNSVSLVKKNYPAAKIIVNSENVGFAAGNNRALKQVKTKYALLLNPDTVVYPLTIRTVIDYMEKNPGVAAATCRVELPDGTLDYSCHRRFPNPWNSFVYFFTGIFKKLSSYSDTSIPAVVHEIDALCGAFAMFRTEVGRKLNWLDEDYWWNGEDIDFCYRIKQAGGKIMFLPDVKITHFKGSSSGLQKTGISNAGKETKLKTANSGVQAMRIFYDKHYARKYPLLFNLFVYLGMLVLRVYRIGKIKMQG